MPEKAQRPARRYHRGALFSGPEADGHRPDQETQLQHRPHSVAPRPLGTRGMRPRPASDGEPAMSVMFCQDVRQVLSDLLAGVAEPADDEALDAHLAECSACRADAIQYLRLHRALGDLPAYAQ